MRACDSIDGCGIILSLPLVVVLLTHTALSLSVIADKLRRLSLALTRVTPTLQFGINVWMCEGVVNTWTTASSSQCGGVNTAAAVAAALARTASWDATVVWYSRHSLDVSRRPFSSLDRTILFGTQVCASMRDTECCIVSQIAARVRKKVPSHFGNLRATPSTVTRNSSSSQRLSSCHKNVPGYSRRLRPFVRSQSGKMDELCKWLSVNGNANFSVRIRPWLEFSLTLNFSLCLPALPTCANMLRSLCRHSAIRIPLGIESNSRMSVCSNGAK